MTFLPNIGLRFRSMTMVILAILPMFGLLVYHARLERSQQLREVNENAARMAELSGEGILQVVEGTRQVLHSVAYSDQVRKMDATACATLFSNLLDNFINLSNVAMAEPSGRIIASGAPMKKEISISDKPWFKRLQQNRAFTIGDYEYDDITKSNTLVLALPMELPEGGNPAVIFATLNLDSLQDCISRSHLIEQSVIAVLDRNGIELARNPAPEKWVGHKAKSWTIFHVQGEHDKFVETQGVDGLKRIYCVIPVPDLENDIYITAGISKDTVLAGIKAKYNQNMIWLAGISLFSIVFAWFFSGFSMLRKVKELTQASRHLAAGQWDTKIPLKSGPREIRQLASAFDEMAASLRAHHYRLEDLVEQRTFELTRTNMFLTQEIEERKNAQAVSAKLMENLERSNKELEQFAYVASHDLQEPLRLVSAYTQLLLQRYGGKLDADAEPIVKFITEGVTRMQLLIQDLLMYSRVSNQENTFSFADAEVSLKDAMHNLAVSIRETNATITHDPLPALLCDSTKLTQVLQNLISNAIKFHGKAAPCVHVSARKTDDQSAWQFSVGDNGIGIEPDYFERIFVIFQRLHTRAKYPGTGIGLAICKRIVEHHGGRIWVESTKGKGSTFYFTMAINPNR